MVIEVEAADVEDVEAEVMKGFRREARLPGFRPGKAPEKMIRARYKKEIAGEVNQRLLSKGFEEGVKETKLDVFQVVESDPEDFCDKRGGLARVTVDVNPEFELPVYEGLKVTEGSTEATDAEVEDAIQNMREQRADYEVVEREAQKGDFVKCGYVGKIGDKEASEEIADLPPMFGTQATTWEEAGSEDAPGVPAIVQGVLGMKAGDRKTVEETFADDFRIEGLQGKTISYEIEVSQVREKVLPEIDEDFVNDFDAESEEELRERLKENISRQKKQRQNSEQRQQIQKQLLEAVEFPIPESALRFEQDDILRDYMQRAMQQGASGEDLEKAKDQLLEGSAGAARDRVRLRMILGKIAEKEEIKVNNEDMGRVIMQQAMMERRRPDDLVKELQKDRARLDEMRAEIVMGKTLDLLLDKAEKQPTAEPTEASV